MSNQDHNSPNQNEPKAPNFITQVNKQDEKKPNFFQKILQSPCCRPILKCFTWEEKYFYETNSLSQSDITNPDDYLLPPQNEFHKGKKTLVLDLDETLVHSSFEPSPVIDIVLPIKLQNFVYKINVIKRPGTEEFLAKMGEIYEVVIFTASLSEYAEPLVKLLDETGIVAHMLYREHCTSTNGIYVKDLSKLGRDLKHVILVDNSPNSFLFQPQNAFHIRNFFDDKTDQDLYELGTFLEFVANVDDVRPVEEWRKKFSSQPASASSKDSQSPTQSQTLKKRNKLRHESTDSNAPLNPFPSNLFNKINEKNSRSNTDLQNSFQDDDQRRDGFDDLEEIKGSKSLRYNKHLEVPQVVSEQKLKSHLNNFGHFDKKTKGKGKNKNEVYGESEMVDLSLPSPKESDNLMKDNPELRTISTGKFSFSNESPDSKATIDQEEDAIENPDADNVKLDEIRFLTGMINPNSPIGKNKDFFNNMSDQKE
jgi:RNA polymerase II subunit A small phosphatase-like protein